MFRLLTIIGIIAVIAALGLLRLVYSRAAAAGAAPAARKLRRWDRLVYFAVLASAIVLAGTGLFAGLIQQQPMAGLMLMLHVSAGSVFVVGLAVLLLGWAELCRFNVHDFPWLLKSEPVAAVSDKDFFSTGEKAAFWCLALLGLVASFTMLISMLHLFGTNGLTLLYEIHRYSGLALVLAGVALGLGKFMFRN